MLIDQLVPYRLQQDFQTFYKARILTAILLIYIVIFLLAIVWIVFAPQTNPLGLLLGSILCSLSALAYLSCLVVLYRRAALRLVAHLTIGITAVSVVCGILLSGGPLDSPATVMSLLPIMMAFVLLDKNNGLIWTCIIMVAHTLGILAGLLGLRYLQLLPDNIVVLQHLVQWFITYAAIVSLMYIVETINRQLQRELDAERQRFQYLASHDMLTNLANRLQFDERLDLAISRAKRSNTLFALLMIDLDGFKPINDNLGHDAGDIVLQEISTRLKKAVRDLDTVSRLGGDEFAIILEGISDSRQIAKIVEKLQMLVKQPIEQLEGAPCVSASIGIAVYPDYAVDKVKLLKYADLAMYCAKQHKNNWCFCHDELIQK